MSRRLLLLTLGLAFLAAACTSEGLPNSYEDQDDRAEKQIVAACEDALVDEDSDNGPEFCQCAFHTVAAELSFTEFLELDERLKDDPGALALEDRQLLESVSLPCEYSSADRNNG
jgi:hypothetical protein